MLSHSIFLIVVLFSNFTIWNLFDQAKELIYKPLPSSIHIEFHLKSYGDFPELLDHDILGMAIRKDPVTQEEVIALYFNPEGTKKLAKITREHINEKLFIFINGQMASSPIIKEEITHGEAIITLGYDPTPEKLKMINLFKEAFQE